MKGLIAVCAFAAPAWIATGQPAHSQTYPTRPITVNVPFAAGGPTDTIARVIAQRMSVTLRQSIIIENVTGADGAIGVGRAARAAPDGYLLSVGQWSTHVLNGAAYSLPYDLLRDFEPVALMSTNPLVIVTHKGVPAANLTELIGWLKANPERATVGIGSMSHRVSAVYFQNLTGTRLTLVPYRGAAPAMQDMMAGQIQLMFDQAATSLPLVRTGSTRPYAVTAATRLAAAPDLPTVDEAGLPGFHIAVWTALWAPHATPRAIIDKLNAAVVEAVADPAVHRRLTEELGQDIPPREQQTPEALYAYQKAEIEKWWPLIKAANIRPE
ncbi:MAG TPA: tripartite tricarboxylate transporter substrate-binding protein [Xanthobacteraceae bacterium]|jgi:tripartite-type tricarboxylate transporter receptor subunit TctC|nr:tripartite tricarboxylate transporter substrate-binding protein [Xanthobacteraceae bacterium]